MLIIIYRPEGGEEERYDARKLKTSEARIVSRTVGMTWAEVKRGVLTDDPEAMRGVVWALKKRGHPSFRFGDFDPGVEELVSRFDAREVAEFCEQIAKADGTEAEIEAAYAELIQNAADPEAAAAFITDFRDPGKVEAGASPTSKSES